VSRVYQLESTTDSRQEAEALATALVERRLAACAQVLGPLTSTYWWEGDVQRAEEFLLLCKVPERRLESAIAALEELHSYEAPEVLAFEVAAGSRRYLDWVEEETAER
jgi:periplasmic divalent cation tolerance protein